jgi:hypothetical protein
MKRQKGQSIVEAILLLVVLLTLTYIARLGLSQMGFIQGIASGPWRYISQLAESGTQPQEGFSRHPNSADRWLTMEIEQGRNCD